MQQLTADDLAARFHEASAHAIAADLIVMIRNGEIPVGTKLPPVRELAEVLGVSPGTVSAAWQTLRNRGVLDGRGRSGVTVVRTPDTPRPERYTARDLHLPVARFRLGRSIADQALLPDLHEALSQMPRSDLNSYVRDRITPALEAEVRRTWPYEPRSVMAVNGGYDGLRVCLHTFVREGDWVLVEDPSPPRMLDLVDATEARAFVLERDEEGIKPSSLIEGLKLNPAALILQPGIHNPSGRVMTERRRDELAEVLRGSPVLVIEDDGLGALFGDDMYPLAEYIDCPHLFVRSYSKSHGPDLRLAVIEGDDRLIKRVQAYFGYGAGWVSRPMQEALAWMLGDPATQERVLEARRTYDTRRQALWRALSEHGIDIHEGTGLDLLVPVRDEGYAEGMLAANGVTILRANALQQKDRDTWIRVSTGTLPVEDADEVASLLARAAR